MHLAQVNQVAELRRQIQLKEAAHEGMCHKLRNKKLNELIFPFDFASLFFNYTEIY